MSTDMTPFADDSRQVSLGELVIENGSDAIAIHGQIDISRDKQSLAAAQALARIANAMVAALEAMPNLPEKVAPVKQSTKTFNSPFG